MRDIDKGRGEYEQCAGYQHERLDHGKVPLNHRLVGQLSKTGPGKYRLDDDRAG